jgi:hypothetical protein
VRATPRRPRSRARSGGDGDDGDEPTYPRTHADLDALAKSSGETLPGDWDDLKTDAKVEWLEEKGVKPE